MKFISFILYWLFAFTFFMCGYANAQEQKDIDAFLNDSAVRTGHAGISIYDPATGKYLYNYNSDKNFLPSSNVKLFTLYAGMKYLGDSLPGIRFTEDDSSLYIFPAGDPTLLHRDYPDQPVIRFLSSAEKKIRITAISNDATPYAPGWAWDDYNEDYMAERSALPVYGNTILLRRGKIMPAVFPFTEKATPAREKTPVMARNYHANIYSVKIGYQSAGDIQVPFITSDSLSRKLLSDAIGKKIVAVGERVNGKKIPRSVLRSRPVDSLFRPMMFESNNFFAEQTLLMVSNERFGFMSDEQIIDTLLKNDLKSIPIKPRWVDGSGLSRYNLFSPKAFIYILDKLQKEFGMERMKRILPTAGQGTLTNYYAGAAGKIYAKTGSMSNNVALSGYLFTRKNKMLLFSILINNYTGSGREGRRAIEKLLLRIRETN